MANNRPKKKNIGKKNKFGIVLIISALLLGTLIIILVAQTKRKMTLSGAQAGAERDLAGGYPLPSELIETDKTTYFANTAIPDMIFSKMNGTSYTEDCPTAVDELRYMNVLYWGIDGQPHKGELIVNKSIVSDITDIFYELYKASYPIENISLISEYGGNDEVSMSNNNTSCFNGRKATGSTEWSKHAYGMAVDLNPLYNPYVAVDGTVLPLNAKQYADRESNFVMKIDENDYAYKLFTEHGFTWGGSWDGVKDYQHFEK